eukprot:Colp12_sorted_trinity150504_noHs@27087
MICAFNGAQKVTITDYPDKELIDNIEFNVDKNVTDPEQRKAISIMGYKWGYDACDLTAVAGGDQKYDVIIMCDLLSNHDQHYNLLKTTQQCLAPGGKVYIFFSHHRPWLAEKDRLILRLAPEEPYSFVLKQVEETHMGPMFPDDRGDLNVRSTLYGYTLEWPSC